MFAEMDWTTVALAAIGLAGSVVSAVVMVRVKQIETRAANDARRSERAADRSEDSAMKHELPKKKRKRKPPGHPCDG